MNEDLHLLKNEDIESVSDNSTEIQPDDSRHEEDVSVGGDAVEDGGSDSEASGSDSSGDSEISVDGGGSADPVEDHEDSSGDVSEESDAEVLKVLESVNEKLDASPDYDGLVDSLRSLVDIMSVQALSEPDAPSIPLSGYEDYSYPVDVVYRVFVTAQNSETEAPFTYDSPEMFEDGYTLICNSVDAGNFAYFSIRTVTDCNGTVVYNADAVTEPEEPDNPEEPDTFKEDVLASLAFLHEDLASVHEDLQSVSMNDLEYREETLLLQQQYLDLEKESRELHYQMLASNIAIGFAVLLTLGYIVAHGFFQRMKVG